MSDIPSHLQYTESHEWVSVDIDGCARIGITDHAQQALGDLVFVELPAVGDEVRQGDACAVVESVKAASDLYAPVSGKITVINEDLDADPGVINTDPYNDGWLFQLELSDKDELDDLKSAEAYAAFLEE
ncbi:MAG: glycine cleavage system protein GcvH [Gammaproteobacteria bacterium]|nr:MAG: glycine cleavage system protein GcvH [Gammaproteobacteria bacterium]